MDKFSSLRKLPFVLIALVSAIAVLGFFVLYSAAGSNIEPWCSRQIINFALFMPLSVIIAILDTRLIYRFSYFFYFLVLLALFGVEFFGSVAMGGQRWINLGITKLQPSEPAKIALVLMLARYFQGLRDKECDRMHRLLLPIIGVAVPALLIIKQPDLGTGLVVLLVSSLIFFAAGVGARKFILAAVTAFAFLPIIWHMMYDYQKRRILMFLDPVQDRLGAGYNIIQSKIAIGSGGMLGKGLGQGTQSHLEFLPEHQTDFIFATMAEELGFLGGIILLVLYAILILISLSISANCKSIFSRLMVIGIVSIFFSHVFINMAMVMGMLPVVGVPLPLISYGGTMMASMLIGFGLIMNASVHRNMQL